MGNANDNKGAFTVLAAARFGQDKKENLEYHSFSDLMDYLGRKECKSPKKGVTLANYTVDMVDNSELIT